MPSRSWPNIAADGLAGLRRRLRHAPPAPLAAAAGGFDGSVAQNTAADAEQHRDDEDHRLGPARRP